MQESLAHERGVDAMEGLARVVDDVEERRPLRLAQPVAERLLHEPAKAPRSVAKDVLELPELAVDVADDVNGLTRQRENGSQVRDLGERGLDRRKAIPKRA